MCDKLEVDHLWFKLINVLDSAKDSQKELKMKLNCNIQNLQLELLNEVI